MAKREIVQIKDKETGDINELRDKALMVAEKSSTPSVATNNSVIPLEKEDGEIIKIKAGSLMKAFASMINSNSKSTITTLFGALTANNNTEFGAINMSNLASLLGVPTNPIVGDSYMGTGIANGMPYNYGIHLYSPTGYYRSHIFIDTGGAMWCCVTVGASTQYTWVKLKADV